MDYPSASSRMSLSSNDVYLLRTRLIGKEYPLSPWRVPHAKLAHPFNKRKHKKTRNAGVICRQL